jgi:VanZ family protein
LREKWYSVSAPSAAGRFGSLTAGGLNRVVIEMIKMLCKISLSQRQKVTLALLFLYWPAIFILTHIFVPPPLLRQMQASDKALHFLAYFILIILLWSSISPAEKVNFRRKKIWVILPLLVFYAGADEWLQGLEASRTRDIMDFVANLEGLSAGLVVICLFSFWPAALAATAAAIVVFTNAVTIQFTGQLAFVRPLFLLTSFGFFTFAWNRFFSSFVPILSGLWRIKSLFFTALVPVGLTLVVKLLTRITGRVFNAKDITLCATAIFIVLAIMYFASLVKKFYDEKQAGECK